MICLKNALSSHIACFVLKIVMFQVFLEIKKDTKENLSGEERHD